MAPVITVSILRKAHFMKLQKFLRALATTCALIFGVQANAAPILLVADGVLTGANNVAVNGVFYDVRFADGTCFSVFNGCSVEAFAFRSPESAVAAANSLLEQVFVDGPDGQFDSNPSSIAGCPVSPFPYCSVFIPADIRFGLFVDAGYLSNHSSDQSNVDFTDYLSISVFEDTSNYETITYAIFSSAANPPKSPDTPPTVDVPEPTSVTLFGLAMAGLAFNRRRKSR